MYMMVEHILKIEDQAKFDSSQLLVLRITGYTMLVLLAGNVLFLIGNVFKYLWRLGVKSALLGMFYCLAFIMTVSRIVEVGYFVRKSNDSPDLLKEQSGGNEVADLIGSVSNVSIGCLFVATMYQIAQSIKIIKDPLIFDFERCRRRKILVFASAVLASVIFAAAMVTIEFKCKQNEAQI